MENPGCDMEIKLLKYSFNFDGISSQTILHKICFLNESVFKKGWEGLKMIPFSYINLLAFPSVEQGI